MTEEVILDVNIDGPKGDDIDKLAKLKSAIVDSKKEIDLLKQAYASGNITQKEYFNGVVTLEAKQKVLNAAYGDTQRKVTGLKSPFDRLQTSLAGNSAVVDKMIPGLGSAASGFIGMAKAALVFIATPIGLAIAAVATAVALFTNELKTNDETADAFDVAMSRVAATMELLRRNISLVVEALSGNMVAMALLAGGIKTVTDNAARLTMAQQALEDQTNLLTLKEGKLINQRDKLIQQSKNKKITDEEAIELNRKAAAIDEELTKVHIALARAKATADIEAIGNTFNIQRKLNEGLDVYAERIIRNSKVSGEEGAKVAAAIKSISDAENTSIKLQEKLDNQRDARLLKIDADAEKAEAKRQKNLDIKNKKMNEEFQAELKAEKEEDDKVEELDKLRQDNKDAANKDARDRELEAVRIHNEEVDKVAQKTFDKEEERKEKTAELFKLIFANAVSTFAEAFKKSNEIGTSLLKGSLITTLKMLKLYLEAKILGESLSTPDSILTLGLTGILRAALIVAGLEAAFAGASAAIEGFAEGGAPHPRGRVGNQGIPIRRSNGDNRLVTMRDDEVVITPSQQARLGGAAALHLSGVPGFAIGGGGSETRAAFNQSFASSSMANMMSRAINSQVPILVLEEFERVNGRKVRVAESAKIM